MLNATNSKSIEILEELGYNVVGDKKWDIFKCDIPNCDIIITNIPFDIKIKVPGWATNDGEIVGIAVAADGFKGYFPMAHEAGGNLDPAMTMKWYANLMASNADKICHNAAYDIGWTKAAGIKVNGRIIDTMIAGAVIDENRRGYSLNVLSASYLGEI